MKKQKVKKTANKVGASTEYKATIQLLGKKFTAKGKTAREAIINLKVGGAGKGMGVIEVVNGQSRKSKILSSVQIFRLFSASKLMREIAIKNVSLMFDGI